MALKDLPQTWVHSLGLVILLALEYDGQFLFDQVRPIHIKPIHYLLVVSNLVVTYLDDVLIHILDSLEGLDLLLCKLINGLVSRHSVPLLRIPGLLPFDHAEKRAFEALSIGSSSQAELLN